jgi:hypothetical protein
MVDLLGRKIVYPPGYKDQIFTLWYSMGKPIARVLYPKVPVYEEFGTRPPIDTIQDWTWSPEFKERAVILDEQVMTQVNQKMVAEKVEMLNRHAVIGSEMQDMAMEYLKKHEEYLGVSSSVRLLVAGVEIERNSRGIATTFDKWEKMSDSQLNAEIQKIIERAPVELMPGESIEGEFTEEQDVTE